MSALKVNHLYLLWDYPTKSVQPNPHNTCLKYCHVKKCHKPYWNRDTLQQPPVTHPQDVLYYHRRKLDWLSLFILDKSFRALIRYHAAAYQYFVYFFQNSFQTLKSNWLVSNSPTSLSFCINSHEFCPFLMFWDVTWQTQIPWNILTIALRLLWPVFQISPGIKSIHTTKTSLCIVIWDFIGVC